MSRRGLDCRVHLPQFPGVNCPVPCNRYTAMLALTLPSVEVLIVCVVECSRCVIVCAMAAKKKPASAADFRKKEEEDKRIARETKRNPVDANGNSYFGGGYPKGGNPKVPGPKMPAGTPPKPRKPNPKPSTTPKPKSTPTPSKPKTPDSAKGLAQLSAKKRNKK